jgi:hypothetical protein
MRKLNVFLPAVAAAALLFAVSSPSPAQVSLGVNIGPEPACPYGYYDYAPYNCAPYGYYGPEWFNGGVFVGSGPWFHGGHDFNGHVDNHFDPHHGYHGAYPSHGAYHAPADNFKGFHGNEMRDGRGHTGGGHPR